jgi:hypothetical protein
MKPVPSEPASIEPGTISRRPLGEPTADENARRDQEADRDFDQGRGIALKDAVAWVRSWFSPHELPRPKSRKIS